MWLFPMHKSSPLHSLLQIISYSELRFHFRFEKEQKYLIKEGEAMKKRQQQPQQQQNKGTREHHNYQQYHHQQQMQKQIQCNKGKACKFKRSSSNLEEDGASSAILLLACIACTPSY